MNNVLCLFHRIILAMMTEWFARCLILFCSLVNLFVSQKVSYSLFKNVVPTTTSEKKNTQHELFFLLLSFDTSTGTIRECINNCGNLRGAQQFNSNRVIYAFNLRCVFCFFYSARCFFLPPTHNVCLFMYMFKSQFSKRFISKQISLDFTVFLFVLTRFLR